MQPFNRALVDPSVTDEEIAQAIDGDPAPYAGLDVEAQDVLDMTAARSLVVVPASNAQRLANAQRLRVDRVNVGVNRCLATVRGPILGLPAVYPTAAIAGEHSSPFHTIGDPASTAVPRASIGFGFNGGPGHVWLELGPVTIGDHLDTIVSTTDFHEPGFEGIALRSRMLTWCGATRWGWGESVNGFDVWEDAAKPKPAPKPWTWEDRLKQLHRDLKRARDNDAPKRHIDGLKHWIDKIEAGHK